MGNPRLLTERFMPRGSGVLDCSRVATTPFQSRVPTLKSGDPMGADHLQCWENLASVKVRQGAAPYTGGLKMLGAIRRELSRLNVV